MMELARSKGENKARQDILEGRPQEVPDPKVCGDSRDGG